jgi:hypothetical protein
MLRTMPLTSTPITCALKLGSSALITSPGASSPAPSTPTDAVAPLAASARARSRSPAASCSSPHALACVSSTSAPASSAVVAATLTASAGWLMPFALGGSTACDMVAPSQFSSSTSRTIVRPDVLRLAGRYGVARNAVCMVASASPASSTAWSWSRASDSSRPLSMYVTSARSCVASARQTVVAAVRSPSRRGVGHSTATATNAAPPAIAHPASLSGSDAIPPASVTGRMNASSSDVVALARTELTTPAKITTKPTTAIATTASQTASEASVPSVTRTSPVSASAACACSRSRSGPLKSASSSIANEPNAANVARIGLAITSSPSANIAGITIAARPARRSAAKSRSRWPSHCSGCTTQSLSPRADSRRLRLRRPQAQTPTASCSAIESTRSG